MNRLQVAVQWGAIGDVGLVIDEMGGSNETVIGGTLPQRMPSCMEAMDYFLQVPHPVVASMILAEKRKAQTGGGQMSLTEVVGNILGKKIVLNLSSL